MIFAPIAREGRPSLATAIIGVVIAVTFTCSHATLLIYYKSWFLYLLVFATTCQTVGFATRLAWIASHGKEGPLYASYLMMIITPSLTLAACHMTFGRILAYTTFSQPKDKKTMLLMPVRIIVPIFVILDIAALSVQLVGGSLTCAAYITASAPDQPNKSLRDVGLQINKWISVVQIIYLGLFAIVTLRFLCFGSSWRRTSEDAAFFVGSLAWVTTISSTLIMLQEINTVIELDSALNNMQPYSASHEWVFWVVDALPIFLVFLSFAVVYPGRCLPEAFTRFYLKKLPKHSPPQRPRTVSYQKFSESSSDDMYDAPAPAPVRPDEYNSDSSHSQQRFQALGELGTHRITPDRWISMSGKTRWYHEISPYESESSYRAYMHGAL